MTHPQHHLSIRRRIYQNLEQFPSSDPVKRFMDRFIFIIGLLGPVMTIPQIVIIWVDKRVTGVSPISWLSYAIFSIFWVVYGIIHKEKPIIITNIIWFFMDLFIAIGAFLYR